MRNLEKISFISSSNSNTYSFQNKSSPSRKISVATDPSGQVAADDKWFKGKCAEDEIKWFEKNAPKPGQLEAKTIKCTVCNECLNFKAFGQIQRHPELGTYI